MLKLKLKRINTWIWCWGSGFGSQILCLISEYSHLSVRALLWLSLAACRSLSRRFFSDSSFSASLGSRRWRGLTYCSSFSSSSFSLMRMRRSRSGSSSPGHASLSSLAICTSMVAILRKHIGGRGEGRDMGQRCGAGVKREEGNMWI